MKNALFATTALVALGFAGAASAAEPLTASVSGFMNMGIGIAENDAGDDVFLQRDGEIHFGFSGTSDNGLTFDGRVELEAFGTEDYIDENWVRVSGTFGALMIGGNDTAKTELAVGVLYAPGDKVGYYDDDATQGFTGGLDGAGDQLGIHYYTPSFAGFSAGVSYLPSDDADGLTDGQFVTSPAATSIWSFGAVYEAEYEGIGVALSGGYETQEIAGADSDTWSIGAQVSAQGFTLAATYEDNLDDTSDYAVGLGYETGPWTFAGGYSHTEADGADDADTYAGWATYALAPGVAVSGGAAYADSGDEDAVIGLTWISLNF